MKTIAIATALLCAGAPGWLQAQGKEGAVGVQRNLLVERAPAVAAPLNNAQRVALIIGNSAYKDAPLANPVNDARAIAQALRESGFDVITLENTDQRRMLTALREFGDRLRLGGTGLFYYAGHGMQIKGRNYLIPVGATIEREDEVAYNAVDAQAVLDKMEAAGNVANIMILDACRNNPFIRSTRSGQAGLAQMDAPVGTLVAYATAPGSVASDGAGVNGLYTQHLLNAIRQPGSKVEDVFKRVRSNVRRDSQGKQVPWESTSLEGDFYFKGGPPVVVAVDPGVALEAALWDAVKDSSLPIELRAYLNRYPSGKFAVQAKVNLARLQAASVLVVNAAVSAPVAPMVSQLHLQPPQSPTPSSMTAGVESVRLKYAVGDKWTYYYDDLLTKKRSYLSRVVTSVAPNGDAVFNDGEQRMTTTSQLSYRRSDDHEIFYSPGCRRVPTRLVAGFKEAVHCETVTKYKDGRESKFVAAGTIAAVGQEKVYTSVGDFVAWRIESQLKGEQGTDGLRETDTIYWFVDEVKQVVAQDITEINPISGKVTRRARQALMNFDLATRDSWTRIPANKEQAAKLFGGESFVQDVAAAQTQQPDSDQADLDKRTSELLAELANKPTAVPVAAGTGVQSNSAGFTVGDRWRFQTVDKFKKEVVRNWGRNVSSIEPDGSLKLNEGAIRAASDGTELLKDFNDGYRTEYSVGYRRFPSRLIAGRSESLRYSMTWRDPNRNGIEETEATMKVVGKELVKVPAGEFEAWKVQITGTISAKNLWNNTTGYASFTEVYWYVPALHNMVASEYERRWGTHLDRFERHELTSFSVRGAENLAQH